MARPIADVVATDRNARLFRAINKYGMNLADFAAISTTSRFDAFGNGTGYTVGDWISAGIFGNLGAVQAVYPIVQSTDDHVDWVLLQSAIDFMIFGAMDSAARGAMKRTLVVPAGHYLINRSLHVGYGAAGTPPTGLNGNRYVSITIEGEGPQVDPQQGGMPGTTIITEALTYPGIVISRPQQVYLKNFTIQGPYDAYLNVSSPLRASNNWDRAAWRQAGMADANWLGGAAVNIGIGVDLYSNATSAAAYPARVLPSYYGGGTTTANFGTIGGTDVTLEDVNIRGFVIGFGRPHGDNNGEFNRIKRGIIANCVHSVVMGHSQNRNVSIEDTNIGGFHTAITSVGGLTGNANLHGLYSNIHFGQGFQLFDHPQGDWSGPLTLRDCYAESFFRIGTWLGRVKFDGCFLSFLEQEGSDGVPYNHFDVSRLILDNTSIGGLRHGLFGKAGFTDGVKVEMVNGSSIAYGQNSVFTGHANLTDIETGQRYMQGLYTKPGPNERIMQSTQDIMTEGYGGFFRTFDVREQMTFFDQLTTSYLPQYPYGDEPGPGGHESAYGAIQRFNVPKISKYGTWIDITSRSGFDLTCPRASWGDIKADVGDVFRFKPDGVDDTLEADTWFMVVSISGSNMVIRQMNNFNSTNSTDYSTNGFYQVGAGTQTNTLWICTRIRQNSRLFVGDVTSGSAVISNIRHAFRNGSTDDFTTGGNFDMSVGDYYIHHEIERANTAGAALKVPNLVSAIDYTANTITLTETFNITRTNYPLPFYIKVYNA